MFFKGNSLLQQTNRLTEQRNPMSCKGWQTGAVQSFPPAP